MTIINNHLFICVIILCFLCSLNNSFVPRISIQNKKRETCRQDHYDYNFLQLRAFTTHDDELLSKNDLAVFETLDNWYSQSTQKIKCPFFRRRAADLIDGFAKILRFLMIRHKSISIEEWDHFMIQSTPPGCRSERGDVLVKVKGLSLAEKYDIILNDWTKKKQLTQEEKASGFISLEDSIRNKHHHVGYYITGKLNSTIYRDDCLFEGYDPDMPVKGLRKYLAAASKLFHPKQSFADLLRLSIEDDGKIVAYWRIGGVIMLPWKPSIKPLTGKTEYFFDKDGLIYLHKESWDISVLQAFITTFWPSVSDKIWRNDHDRICTEN